jgi:protein-S-isoprenylcysteine O-methyltransferase Ste14
MNRFSIAYFTLITLFWLLEFLLFRPRHRSRTYEEKRSFSWISITIVVSITLSVQFTRWELFLMPIEWRPIFEIGGLILYTLGISLRYLGSIALGAQFTRNISVDSNQPLISHSVYRSMRHPLYVGLFLLLIAVPIYLSNWLMMVVAGGLMYLVLHQRIQLEEAKMEELLGERYLEWKAQRGKFFPLIRQKKTAG